MLLVSVFVESGEKALRDKLFRNYSNDIRPVKDLSKTLYVNITLTIMQIVRLDEQNQVMTTSVQIKLVRHCYQTLKWAILIVDFC